MIEREAVADTRAAIMANAEKCCMPQRCHQAGNIVGHGALGKQRAAIAGGCVGFAIAAQVRQHECEMGCQRGRDLMPFRMGLRIAMDHHQRRSAAAHARDNGPMRAGPALRRKSGKKVGQGCHMILVGRGRDMHPAAQG